MALVSEYKSVFLSIQIQNLIGQNEIEKGKNHFHLSKLVW